MPVSESKVTIHMVASVDGFIEKPDRSVSWLQSSDSYEKGITLTDEAMEERRFGLWDLSTTDEMLLSTRRELTD